MLISSIFRRPAIMTSKKFLKNSSLQFTQDRSSWLRTNHISSWNFFPNFWTQVSSEVKNFLGPKRRTKHQSVSLNNNNNLKTK